MSMGDKPKGYANNKNAPGTYGARRGHPILLAEQIAMWCALKRGQSILETAACLFRTLPEGRVIAFGDDQCILCSTTHPAGAR